MKKFEKIGDQIVAIGLTVIVFWLIGIVVNALLVEKLFGVNAADITIWSGGGMMFAIIAGLSGILALKVYRVIRKG